jgi:hypothetical protein
MKHPDASILHPGDTPSDSTIRLGRRENLAQFSLVKSSFKGIAHVRMHATNNENTGTD